MKKALMTLLLSLFINPVFAGEGIITVLEAPVVRDRTLDASVVLLKRKGEKIYIHDRYFKDGPLDVVYQADDKTSTTGLNEIGDDENFEKFYETIDKNGNTAYVSRHYVKLIYKDVREFNQAVTPFRPDPTDYRLAEPLPEGYPVVDKERYRAKFSFSVGPDIRSNYNYNQVLVEEEFSNRYGFEIAYGRKAGWDDQDRFYFGGFFHGWTSQAKFTLFDDRQATENRSQIGMGPYLSYDPWRNNGQRVTLLGALSINYTRNFVMQKDPSGFDEERLFNSLSLAPRLQAFYQKKTPTTGMDFIAGFDVQFYLPHSLTSDSEPNTGFWNEFGSQEDSVFVPFTAHWSVFIGVQSRY